MKAYLRTDPLIDERKGHYTPAQLGTYLLVLCKAARQKVRGRFHSALALKNLMPAAYVRHLPFLYAEGDLVELPDGVVYVDGWDEWQEGDFNVAERMARMRGRKRHATVTPTVTNTVTQPSPTAIRSDISVSTDVDLEASTEPRVLLSAEQLAAWKDFKHPRWQPFREAWLERGFHNPPHGEWDDPKSQRSLLWEIADARPDELAGWVRGAPGRSVRDVIGWVLERWHEARREAAKRADAQEAESARHKGDRGTDGTALKRIGTLLGGPA